MLQRLDLDTINLTFLLLGLALHGSARAYSRAVSDAIAGTAGIVLQFPLYFGIMALMASSGLVGSISDRIVAVSRGHEWAYPALTFLSAEQDELRDRYNTLWRRLMDVERGATELRRHRAPGVPFAGGRLYHIEEARPE